MAAIQRQHNVAIVRVSYTENLLICKHHKIQCLMLVEAAGVEPASEIVYSRETPCSVGSIGFALCAQNRQDAHNPSPEISLLRLGPGHREPACCMTFFRSPQTKPRRTATYLIKQLMPVDCWQLFVLRAITGAHTPACLYTAIDPVETVTPPSGGKTACSHRDTTKMILFFALSPACR